MGMQINTNIAANNTYRNLTATQNDMSKSLEKLSSGLRINRASDDAAGLTVSEGLKSQVGGLTVASRNAQDGISVVQTAEGSLSEVQSILQRVRDLAVQAGNDSNNTASRTAIGTEVKALTSELTRIAGSTNFNGTQLLDGGSNSVGGVLNFQVGANGDASSQITVNLGTANVSTIVSALDFGTTASKTATAATLSLTHGYEFTQGGTTVTVAAPTTAPTSNAGVATNLNADKNFAQNFLASTDATGGLLVTSKSTNTAAITIKQDVTAAGTYADATTVVAGSQTMGFDTAAASQLAIAKIDQQIAYVSTARAALGATQNRFESVVKTLAVSTENLTAAGSRIRDTDMAAEMVKYTRSSILVQAGTAMLAQANQGNQGVLKLLQ